MKISLFMSLVITATFSLTVNAKEKLTASQIMKKVEESLRSKDELAHVDMKIIEKNGKSKTRKLIIKKKNRGKKEQILVRLEKPSDLRGIGLLSIINGMSEDQWLYTPSNKKVRRIISSNKKDSFLGSEFSYEDFSPTTYSHFHNKVVKVIHRNGKDLYVIESTALERVATYSKIITLVTKLDYRILQSKYFDHKGKKLKVMTFKGYKKFGKNTWRAQSIDVKNIQNKRGTKLMLSKLQLNTGMKDSEFSKSALQRY